MKRPALEVVDLTHAVRPDMPVFPGTQPPRLEDSYTIGRDGFAEKTLHLVSHTGTHIDAPGHILPGAPRLDAFAAGSFLGPGVVLDAAAVRGRSIEVSDIDDIVRQLGRPVTLWDNYPVNDGALRSKYLYTSKLAAALS